MVDQRTDLSGFIRAIPDWPKPGILFRDITPLLADHKALLAAVDELCVDYHDAGIDVVGFLTPLVALVKGVFGQQYGQAAGIGLDIVHVLGHVADDPIRQVGLAAMPFQRESCLFVFHNLTVAIMLGLAVPRLFKTKLV